MNIYQMKRLYFSYRALCAGLVLGGLFTFSSSNAANNETNDNNVVAAAPANNSQIVSLLIRAAMLLFVTQEHIRNIR